VAKHNYWKRQKKKKKKKKKKNKNLKGPKFGIFKIIILLGPMLLVQHGKRSFYFAFWVTGQGPEYKM